MSKIMHKIISGKYDLKKVICEKANGKIVEAECRQTKKQVVLKIMKDECTNEYEIIKVLREIEIMTKLNNLS